MKVDDLKDLKDLDAMFPTDPFEIYCYGEDSDKKKRSKKSDSFKDSLHELSKKELRKKAEDMGVDLRFVDTDSKKALRGAIMDARKSFKKAKGGKSKKGHDDSWDDKKELTPIITSSKAVDTEKKPHFYFDMDTHDFVIHGADDLEDDIMLDAMRAIGAIRREKRPKDGFGELMLRMDAHIKHGIGLDEALDPATDPNVIEVEDFHVVDDAATPALPSGGKSNKKRHN